MTPPVQTQRKREETPESKMALQHLQVLCFCNNVYDDIQDGSRKSLLLTLLATLTRKTVFEMHKLSAAGCQIILKFLTDYV